jgi:hypothetical protein
VSIRHLTVALIAVVALAAIPAAANASVSDELAASNKVERVATRYYPRYDFTASCDQEGRGYFWCDVIGQNDDCFMQGHASVRMRRNGRYTDWWTTLRAMNRDCY